ncbi:MAG: alkaline phosphatase family protein [Myxococcota bacterium]
MSAQRRAHGLLGPLAALALACAGGAAHNRAAPSLPQPGDPAGRPAVVLLISVAGLTSPAYRVDAARPTAMPTLAALAKAGAAADAVESVAPAATYPAHASLVSGRVPAEHGIIADRLLGDHGVRDALYWHASHLRAPTLWQLAHEARLPVASLAWPSTVGASIALLLPDLVPTRRGETWLGVLEDSTTPSVLEFARRAGGAAEAADRVGPARDAVLAEVACRILSEPRPPSLLLLRLSQTRPVLAAHGPDSPEAFAAFGAADREIAGLLDCLGSASRLDAATLFVVGDHGTLPLYTLLSPNAVLAREGLLTPAEGDEGEVATWSAIARSNGGSTFVYAQSESHAVRARRALAAAAERTRGFRVVPAAEMLALGADPGAWFGLEAEPGFAFDDAARGALIQPAAQRGAWGYLPARPEMNAGFVAWGAGIRSGVRIPLMRQTDVAPTVAVLLGLSLEGAEGRPLVGALSPALARAAGRPR